MSGHSSDIYYPGPLAISARPKSQVCQSSQMARLHVSTIAHVEVLHPHRDSERDRCGWKDTYLRRHAGTRGHDAPHGSVSLQDAFFQSRARSRRSLHGRPHELRELDAARLPHSLFGEPAVARVLPAAEGPAQNLARLETLPAVK